MIFDFLVENNARIVIFLIIRFFNANSWSQLMANRFNVFSRYNISFIKWAVNIINLNSRFYIFIDYMWFNLLLIDETLWPLK